MENLDFENFFGSSVAIHDEKAVSCAYREQPKGQNYTSMESTMGEKIFTLSLSFFVSREPPKNHIFLYKVHQIFIWKLITIILGACYEYDIDEDEYDTTTGEPGGFLWQWTHDQSIKYFHDSRKEKFKYPNFNHDWRNLGFMGHNFLYNGDGIVFSAPLALSTPFSTERDALDGSESGTLILKKEDGKKFYNLYCVILLMEF